MTGDDQRFLRQCGVDERHHTFEFGLMHGHIACRIDHARLDVGRRVAHEEYGQGELPGGPGAKGGLQTAGTEAACANQDNGQRRQIKWRQRLAPARRRGGAARERVVAARATLVRAFSDVRRCASSDVCFAHANLLSSVRLLGVSTAELGLTAIFCVCRLAAYLTLSPRSVDISAQSCCDTDRYFKPKTSCMSNNPFDFPCKIGRAHV